MDETIANAEPFVIAKSGEDTDGEYVRFEAIVHPSLDADSSNVDLNHERYLIDNPDEHVHPDLKEVIEVITGEYAVEFEGTEHRLREGEEITIPQGVAHRHWNPTAKPARVAHEHHPAIGSDEHARTMYALAQDGKTNEKGVPNPLRFAVISKAYPGLAYTTGAPIWLQKLGFAVLAPVGRALGYEATYERRE